MGIGGAQRHLLKLVPKLNLNCFVISLMDRDAIGKKLEKKGVKIYYLGLTEKKLNFPIIFLRFIKVILKEKPDVIDSYLPHSNITARIFGRAFGVKKIICSIRNDYSSEKSYNLLDRSTKHLVDLYIPNSKTLLPYLTQTNNISSKKITILPNGIDIKRIYDNIDLSVSIREELGLNRDNFLLVVVARLVKNKSISTIIKAMKHVKKEMYLLIVGDGKLYNYLTSLTKKLHLMDRIFFLGYRGDVFTIVNQSDLFILPSLKEGMSNALLEAMALKKLCLVSDIPQNKVLIKDRSNGFLFETRNHIDLAKKINYIYDNRNFNNLKEKAYETIMQKYNINKIAERYTKIIKIVRNMGN
jgi:glycosyltransferase involved in cell wall biosynthesis